MKYVLGTNDSSVLPLNYSAMDCAILKPRSESAPTKRIGTNAIEGGTKSTYHWETDTSRIIKTKFMIKRIRIKLDVIQYYVPTGDADEEIK